MVVCNNQLYSIINHYGAGVEDTISEDLQGSPYARIPVLKSKFSICSQHQSEGFKCIVDFNYF